MSRCIQQMSLIKKLNNKRQKFFSLFNIPIDKYNPKILKNIRIKVFKISKFP